MKRTDSRVAKEIAEIKKAIRKEARKQREEIQALQNLYGLRPLSKVYGVK